MLTKSHVEFQYLTSLKIHQPMKHKPKAHSVEATRTHLATVSEGSADLYTSTWNRPSAFGVKLQPNSE